MGARRGPPPHGTYARYVSKRFKCRCDPCRRAQRHYQERRKLDLFAGRPRTVLVIGTVRRIQALMAQAWSGTYLAERCGVSRANLPAYPRSRRIDAEFAAKVELLYDELSVYAGPSRATRGRALRAGMLPPEWWDGVDMDDPDALPIAPDPDEGIDEVAVRRVVNGQWQPLNDAERAEAIRQMLPRYTKTEIASYLHVSGETINKLLEVVA